MERLNSMNLEGICTNLETGLPEDVIRTLWTDVPLPSAGPSLRESYNPAFLGVFLDEVYRLKRLLTENTVIRLKPLAEFGSKLYEILTKVQRDQGTSLSACSDLRRIFGTYRIDPDNFSPLANTVHEYTGEWGSFVSCQSSPNEEAFALACGEMEHVLVHFDQWLLRSNWREEIIDRYVVFVEDILQSGDYSFIVVEKEFGPVGPSILWGEIASRISQTKGPLRYNQRTKTVDCQVEKDSQLQAGKGRDGFVVLYDLIVSGDGLHEIKEYLELNCEASSVINVVLYDYCDAKKRADLGPTHVIYDAVSFPSLRSDHLSKVSKDINVPIHEGGKLFANTTIVDVEPIRADRYDLPEDMEWVDKLEEDEMMVRQLAGQWVAVFQKGIIAQNSRYEDLIKEVESLNSKPFPLIHYFEPVETVRGV